jgi:O-methyltransferase
MVSGGFIIFDDYGMPSCPGARAAVDQFFADKPEKPLALHTGQALVFRGNTGATD